MHVVVIGAGIVGVTTAYELAQDGHAVTVVDRAVGPGLETSFSNGGQISASHTDAWASPENLRRIVRWFGKSDAPLRLAPGWDMTAIRWCASLLGNCTRKRANINTERMLRLALYSRNRYAHLRNRAPFNYDLRQNGILHIYRNRLSFQYAKRQAAFVRELGCARNEITVDQCLDLEPALVSARNHLCGAVYCAEDECGDAHKFCMNLAKVCEAAGVNFRFNETVSGIVKRNGSVTGVATTSSSIPADALVVSAGCHSTALMRTVGITLPVYPAKGYSVTLPVEANQGAPGMGLIDDELKLVYSRLGENLRVAGMAELAGYDVAIDVQRASLLVTETQRLFPTLQRPVSPQYWCGLRPQTPDSVPLMGPCGADNLFLNTGHGTLGWTMAAGSARITADLISGNIPEVDTDGLTMHRFSRMFG